MDAILNISKCSMMPEWHYSDFSRTMYALPESAKKKKFKIKFQVPLKFAWILPDYNFHGGRSHFSILAYCILPSLNPGYHVGQPYYFSLLPGPSLNPGYHVGQPYYFSLLPGSSLNPGYHVGQPYYLSLLPGSSLNPGYHVGQPYYFSLLPGPAWTVGIMWVSPITSPYCQGPAWTCQPY